MFELANKKVLVIGLGDRGQAACELLRRSGANVFAVDTADNPRLRQDAARLRPLGIEVALGVSAPPASEFSLAVLSPAAANSTQLVQAVARTNVPMIGEFELGFQQSRCLNIAVAGTNGKTTTAELIEKILINHHRKIILSGHRERPVCSVVEQTRELDFLVLQADSFQLETTEYFRPAVAVLTSLAPAQLERHGSVENYIRANARLFRNQQAFDWAIVQSEALAQLRKLDLPVPSKTITYSATDSDADIYLDRGLLISRLPNWSGPLLDIDHCRLRGPHNAENLMAALSVGHVLRVPLESMLESVKVYTAGAHRFESIAEINGVEYINDSKATNPDALHKALLAVRPGGSGNPNILLIAGGLDSGLAYHDLGPILSKRVKKAFLIGEAAEKIRAAWSLFTPCTVFDSLLQATTEAAKSAACGDVVLLSPACSSFDQFRSYEERGERFCQIVKSIGRGA